MNRVALTALLTLAAGSATFAIVFAQSSGYLIRNDGTAYFMYARSAVIDLDTDVTNEYEDLDSRLPADSPVMMAVRDTVHGLPDQDRIVFPWPVGSGLVMAPFYALGYGLERLVAAIGNRPADSYGVIPQYFYGLGSLFYGFLGFWATFLLCQRLTGDPKAWLSTLAVLFGGPVVFYLFFHPSMAHAASFGLVSLLALLWWRRWTGQAEGLVGLGLLFGTLVTIRYQNAVFGILLVALILRHARRESWPSALRAGLVGGLASLPPLVIQVAHVIAIRGFPSAITGGSRGDTLTLAQNELDLASPHFFQVMFSCQHGAFYWAPVLGLGFGGLLWAARGATWARIFCLVFLGHVYLIGCLQGLGGTNWSGAHAFGMRYLAECSPLLAAGLAVLVHKASSRLARRGWIAILALAVTWNGLLILAYGKGTISRSECVTYRQMAAGVFRALPRL